MSIANNKIADSSTNIDSRKRISENPDAGDDSLPRTSRKTNKQHPISIPHPSNNNACRHPKPGTKASLIVKKLRSARGVTIEALIGVTGWQAHSVRGFLSGRHCHVNWIYSKYRKFSVIHLLQFQWLSKHSNCHNERDFC